MNKIIFAFLIVVLSGCGITESENFLKVELENQQDHEGILVRVFQDFGDHSVLTNSKGEFHFDNLYDMDAKVIACYPFFEPDTQFVQVVDGEIVGWNPVILKQILSVELLPEEITVDYSDINSSGTSFQIEIQIKITNHSVNDFNYESYYQPQYCPVIRCIINMENPENLFTLGSFGDNDFPAGASGCLKPGETFRNYYFYIGYEEIVKGEYELYLAPNNSANDRFFYLLNENIYGKRNLIKPVRLVVE
jgi:hypothetical protein